MIQWNKALNLLFVNRHVLAIRRQQPTETLDEYLQVLKTLARIASSRMSQPTSIVKRI